MTPTLIAQFTLERTGQWIAMLCVIAILSLLWKENKLYRAGEHILLGLSVGFLTAVTWFEFLKPKWYEPLVSAFQTNDLGNIIFGISALFLGLCWYGMYFKKTEWLMRLVLGVVIGAGAGQAIRNQFTQQMPVITSSFKSPLVVQEGTVNISQSLSNTLFLIAIATVLLYFFFSFEVKSPFMKSAGRIGRFWLMVGFGAYFGNTVMTRLAVLIERVWFVADDFARGFIK